MTSVPSTPLGWATSKPYPSARDLVEVDGLWMPRPVNQKDTKDWFGFAEQMWEVTCPWVKEFDCALDIGAHVGIWTRHMAKAFTHVFAFEPNPYLYPCLVKNVAANVSIVPYAVGEKSRKVAVTTDSLNEHTPSVHVFTDREGRITMIPLDEKIDKHWRIGFIKIDVEGMEELVLKGAEQIISRDHPVIVVEVKNLWERYLCWGARSPAIWLAEHGYMEVGAVHRDRAFVYKVG